MQRTLQLQFLFDDRYKHIYTDRDPDLRLDGVDRGAKKRLDSQVLFDPLEEQFDLPSQFVQLANGQCIQLKIVGQKDECSLLFFVSKRNPS